jgi:hypothetical protein
MKEEFEDEFSGVNAQDDPEFRQEGGDFSAEGLSEIEQMEQELANGEFAEDEQALQGLDYESFVILKKQDILKFLRAVEPWIKVSVDQYGKCIRIRSIADDQVELSYINNNVAVTAILPNRSGKKIPEYFMQVSTFKRIITETYASLVLVHENNELNIALLDNILFVETLKLNSDEYKPVEMPDKLTTVDTEALTLITKKLAFVLSATDRAAEKVVNFDGDYAYISTAVFAAVVKNPFQEGSMAISKVCLDLLGVLTEVSKLTFNIAIQNNEMLIEVDGLWRVRLPIYKLDTVLVDKAKEVTGFTGTIEVSNESLIKLVDVTRAFEYLSEVLEFKVSDKLRVDVRSKDLTRTVSYEFPFEGTPETTDEIIRVSAAVVKPYLHLGGDAKYAFTKQGWGLDTVWGKLLIRKTV